MKQLSHHYCRATSPPFQFHDTQLSPSLLLFAGEPRVKPSDPKAVKPANTNDCASLLFEKRDFCHLLMHLSKNDI